MPGPLLPELLVSARAHRLPTPQRLPSLCGALAEKTRSPALPVTVRHGRRARFLKREQLNVVKETRTQIRSEHKFEVQGHCAATNRVSPLRIPVRPSGARRSPAQETRVPLLAQELQTDVATKHHFPVTLPFSSVRRAGKQVWGECPGVQKRGRACVVQTSSETGPESW